jgi:antitoxin VapB
MSQVSLNIKNPEVHKAAVQLARRQGTTITEAVLRALQAELKRTQPPRTAENEVARMEEVARRVAALPILDDRSEDEILGYGPAGYPEHDAPAGDSHGS